MTICETKCEYEGYEFDSKKVKCKCEVKIKIPLISEIEIYKNILLNKLDIKNSLNIKILRCYKLLFSKNGFKDNIGSYIIISIIFISTIIIDNNKGHSPPKNRAKTNKEINYFINNLQTKGDELNGNSSVKLNKKKKKKDKIEALNIGKINIEKDKINMIKNYNDYEINNLTYNEAKKYDKRGYIDYYFSLLRRKNILIFEFYTYNDYNSRIVKICLFFFFFCIIFYCKCIIL